MLKIVDKLEHKLKALDDQLQDPATSSDIKKIISLNRERRQLEELLSVAVERDDLLDVR